MENHFCNCPVAECPRHPQNHTHGCDPCIKDNLKKGKMPACLFRVVHDDTGELTEFTIESFVDYYAKHQDDFKKRMRS